MPYIDSSEELPALSSGADVKVGKDANGDWYDAPTFDISLSDSLRTVGLVLCDTKGNPLPENFSLAPFPKMASQIREGRGKWDDQIKPFADEALINFAMGRGIRYRDEKAGGFFEGFRADVRQAGRVYIGPAETYIPGIRHYQENWFNDTDAGNAYSWDRMSPGLLFEFTADDSYNMSEFWLMVRRKGTLTAPGGGSPYFTITLRIKGGATLGSQEFYLPYLDSETEEPGSAYGGEIGSSYNMKKLIITANLLNSTYPATDGAAIEALSNAVTYEIVVSDFSALSPDADNDLYILTDGSNPYYRILDDTGDFKCLYFEYMGGYYCITQPADRTASKLYLLGYRGIADANTGALTKLKDSSASWVTNEFANGGIAHIVGGTGSAEVKPFREIWSNTGIEITVPTNDPWIIEHDTTTLYYIEYNKWQLIKTFDYYVTDVEVADRVIQLAFGQDDYHQWLRYGNDDGVWTEELLAEPTWAWKANYILAIHNPGFPERRQMFDLYIARNMKTYQDRNYPNNVMMMNTPPYFGFPIMILGQLVDNAPWIYQPEIAEVDQYPDRGWFAVDVTDVFTTGTLAERRLAPSIDMSKAEMIGFSLSSTIDFDAGDLYLTFGDGTNTWDVDLPAITADDDMHDVFHWYTIELQAPTAPKSGSNFPDFTKIDRVLLKSASDKNIVYKLKFGESGFLLLTRDFNNHRYEFGVNEKITNLLEYGGGSGQETKKVWIITDLWVYYIEDGQLKPLYLEELKEYSHYLNGQAAVVWGVYLLWNTGEEIQRYFQGRLDSIGPDIGDKPIGYVPGSMVGYAGHLFASYGNRIMVYRNSAWSEYWNGGIQAGREPLPGTDYRMVGSSVTTMDLRAMTEEPDRLYFNQGADIAYVPVTKDPGRYIDIQNYYRFAPEAVIRSSTVTSSRREVEKYFNAVRIVAEYLDSTGADTVGDLWIEVAYKTSNDSTWVELDGEFDVNPAERIRFSDDYDVEGLHIELEIRLYTANNDQSPVLLAAIIENLEREIVNFSRNVQCRLYAGNDINKLDKQDDQTGEQKWAWLKTKMNSPLPVLMKSNSKFVYPTRVFIEPVLTTPVIVKKDANDNEMHICPFSLTEVWNE